MFTFFTKICSIILPLSLIIISDYTQASGWFIFVIKLGFKFQDIYFLLILLNVVL